MGLLSGALALTRFQAQVAGAAPAFDDYGFVELRPGSEVKESVGFVPFEPGALWEVGTRRFAFRVRIDRQRPDPTAVAERLRQLVTTELEATGLAYLASAKRRELRALASEEIARRSLPTSKIVECCLDGSILHVASTAKAHLGAVLQLLRHAGVAAEPQAPWLTEADPEPEGTPVAIREPCQSLLGCRFLRALIEEGEILVEPLAGYVRLQTREAKIILSGGVLPELMHLLEGGAEVLAARLLAGSYRFRFDALAYRLSGLVLENESRGHWTELLDERLEKIDALWALLDEKYAALRPVFLAGESAPVPA